MKLSNLLPNSNITNWRSLKGYFSSLIKRGDVIFGLAILFIIGILLFPVPAVLMDLLLSFSIALSVLVLMTVLFIDEPLDISSFPSILLLATVLRLALNISTTRLILAHGHQGTDAAGHVIEAFGYFVMQGSLVIGIIVFSILTIINFIVITKGSGRIAEVAARFSLDAMPGKQMAIDADLTSGAISQDEAKMRRKTLENESTFFGAMDGANKFVRGDAVAGLLITFINFIAGIIIGVIQKDMTLSKALYTYTILTIGDGLVSQIPALIVSIAAGLLVTKSGVTGSADKAIFEQLGKYPKALMFSSALSFFMALMPGIPAPQFMFAGALMGFASYFLYSAKDLAAKKAPLAHNTEQTEQTKTQAASAGPPIIEKIKIELGYDLIALANDGSEAQITKQLKQLRLRLANELGIILPSVKIQDNLSMENDAYCIKIKEIEVGSGTVKVGKLMVIDPKGEEISISGEDIIEPAFGLMARWIEPKHREEAIFKGYTVVESSTVVITHLTEILKENVSELLTYEETENLLENINPSHKKLVSDLIPEQISVITLQRVLQSLLSEAVSIRDLPAILESISEFTNLSEVSVYQLVEHVRVRLSKQICYANITEAGYIPILLLSNHWEDAFNENSIMTKHDGKKLTMPPTQLQEFVSSLNNVLDSNAAHGEVPVLLTSPGNRYLVRSVIERVRPNLTVMSQNEVHPRAKIKTLGYI